jgi:hypothetical protein
VYLCSVAVRHHSAKTAAGRTVGETAKRDPFAMRQRAQDSLWVHMSDFVHWNYASFDARRMRHSRAEERDHTGRKRLGR